MKKKSRKTIVIFLFMISCFFVKFDGVFAAQTYATDYNFYTEYRDGKKVTSFVREFDPTGNYFNMCYYKINDVSEGITGDIDNGYVLIMYNPVTDNFAFKWNFFEEKVTSYRHDPSDQTSEIDYFYFYESRYGSDAIDCKVNSSDLSVSTGSTVSICNFSEDDGIKYPYVRFYTRDANGNVDNSVIENLKKGICPSKVDYTSQKWSDDSGVKRICFTNNSNGCNDLDGAWNDYNKDKEWSPVYGFSNCGSYISPVSCIINKIRAAERSIKLIDASDDKYCDHTVRQKALDDIITALDAEVLEYTKQLTVNGAESQAIQNLNLSNSVMFSDEYRKIGDAIAAKSSAIDASCSSAGITEEGEIEAEDQLWYNEKIDVLYSANSNNWFDGDQFSNCAAIQNTEFYEKLQYAFTAIKIATPILTVFLIMKDMIAAVTAGKEDAMKKAQKNSIVRLIVGIVIMFLPTLIDIIVTYVDKLSGGSCGIK